MSYSHGGSLLDVRKSMKRGAREKTKTVQSLKQNRKKKEKMASCKERFELLSKEEIDKLSSNAQNENTNRSTRTWINQFVKWAEWKEKEKELSSYDPAALNETLCEFYAELRKTNGKNYEPDCLATMQAALDRYLKEKKYPHSILRDPIFKQSQDVLEGKARQLRIDGLGKKPNATKPITNEEEDLLWESGQLGSDDAEILLQTLWFLTTQHFGLRARQEHHSMRMENFKKVIGENGTEYIEFHENPTKTRGSGLHPKVRVSVPKAFKIEGPRCLVTLFDKFVEKRPDELKNTGPFYLGINRKISTKNENWYLKSPMGKNTISGFMKKIIKDTPLETSGKRLSNHSMRKFTVKKLKASNFSEESIVKVTGHKNGAGLRAYDEGDENEFRNLSLAIDRQTTEHNNVQYSSREVNSDKAFTIVPLLLM